MGKIKKSTSCYICSQPATSKEHVPPVCLFPEEKDIKTSIFRNNLITVPSCDLHNSKKSKDDEFLMACLAGIVGNNVIGFFHNVTKVKRALARQGEDLVHILMRDSKKEVIKNIKGDIIPVLVGRPDFDRLRSCFLHIAYGLYYHKFGKAFKGECHILMDFLTYDTEESEKYRLLCRKRFEWNQINLKQKVQIPKSFGTNFLNQMNLG